MRKTLLKNTVFVLALAALAGCNGGGDKELSEAHFDIAVNQIALTVPLAIERSSGVTIQTNVYRTAHNISTPVLKDGNDITLTTEGTLNYEDDDEGIYLNPKFSVAWSFLQNENYATFEFDTDRNDIYYAIPDYPTYLPEYDSGGNPIHVIPSAKAARLYAVVTIGSRTKTINIDLILDPQQIVEFASLLDVRELTAGDLIGVRGYVTGVFPDWNTAGIADGKWGLGLYRLDSDFKNSLEVGDLVEAIGQVSNFNGLAQLQWLKSIKILDPEDYPDVKLPEVQEYSVDDLATQLGLPASNLTGPLQDKDNAIIKFSEPFRFKRVEDRNTNDVGFAGFDLSGSDHTNVILEGTTSADKKFEVKLSINYHMGSDEQTLFKNWLVENQDKDIYYLGPISAYNELVFGPYEFTSSFGPALSLTPQ